MVEVTIEMDPVGENTEIRAHVVDAESDDPIEGAVVGVWSNDSRVDEKVTDEEGEVVFNDVQPNNYDIVASAPGYEDELVSVLKEDFISE